MVTLVAFFFTEFLFMPIGHHIKLTTHNRLDGLTICGFVFARFGHKLKHAKHVTVVGNRQSTHTIFCRFLKHRRDRRCSVK